MLDLDGAAVDGQFAFQVVQRPVLEDEHRIRVLKRQPEHSARVVERGRREQFQTGNVREPALEAVRMLRRDGKKIGIASNFAIMDDTDQKQIIRDILHDLDLDERQVIPGAALHSIGT